jgi:hypothetical protein
MSSAPEPPFLDDAAAFTKALARELSQLSGDPYGEPSIGELQAGIAMEEEGLGNPAAFAHTTIDWYIQGTGDFLYGAGETSKDQYDLAFSSAAATRSACEYAGICWWLADPDISVERRISRTADLVSRALDEAKSLLSSEELAEYQEDNKLLNWAQKYRSRNERLPNATERFKLLSSEYGKLQYSYLSMLAHGNIVTTGRIVQEKVERSDEPYEPPLWKLLLASSYALTLADRVCRLRSRPPSMLPELQMLYEHYRSFLPQSDS